MSLVPLSGRVWISEYDVWTVFHNEQSISLTAVVPWSKDWNANHPNQVLVQQMSDPTSMKHTFIVACWRKPAMDILSQSRYQHRRPTFTATVVSDYVLNLRSEAINYYAITSDQPDLTLSNIALSFKLLIWTYNYRHKSSNIKILQSKINQM